MRLKDLITAIVVLTSVQGFAIDCEEVPLLENNGKLIHKWFKALEKKLPKKQLNDGKSIEIKLPKNNLLIVLGYNF